MVVKPNVSPGKNSNGLPASAGSSSTNGTEAAKPSPVSDDRPKPNMIQIKRKVAWPLFITIFVI